MNHHLLSWWTCWPLQNEAAPAVNVLSNHFFSQCTPHTHQGESGQESVDASGGVPGAPSVFNWDKWEGEVMPPWQPLNATTKWPLEAALFALEASHTPRSLKTKRVCMERGCIGGLAGNVGGGKWTADCFHHQILANNDPTTS